MTSYLRIPLSLFVLIWIFPTNGFAFYGVSEGNDFYESCQGARYYDTCAAYIQGLTEATTADSNTICIPNGTVTFPQLRDLLINYLRHYPKERSQPTLLALTKVLVKEYPCKNSYIQKR